MQLRHDLLDKLLLRFRMADKLVKDLLRYPIGSFSRTAQPFGNPLFQVFHGLDPLRKLLGNSRMKLLEHPF